MILALMVIVRLASEFQWFYIYIYIQVCMYIYLKKVEEKTVGGARASHTQFQSEGGPGQAWPGQIISLMWPEWVGSSTFLQL